jgi:hypothetical protein
MNQQDISPTVLKRQGEGNEVWEETKKFSQAPHFKLDPSEEETRGFKSIPRPILRFPIPDYSKIKPKADTWRKTLKTSGEDKKTKPQQKKDKGCGCFRWCRSRKTNETANLPVPDDILQTRNRQGTSLSVMPQSRGKKNQVRKGQMTSVQPPAMKLELSDAVTRANKKYKHVGVQCNRHFQSPDYSKIPPRVDTASQVKSSRMVQKISRDDMNTEPKEMDDQGLGCFHWRRRRESKKRIIVPVPDHTIQIRSQQDTSPALMFQCEGKGDLVRDSQVTCAQGNDIKPESSDTVIRANKRNQQGGVHRIRNFPNPYIL